MIAHIDKTTFDENAQKPCVVDFYTTGCPPCEKLAPVFEQAAGDCADLAFYKVNLDDDITLAERFSISHVPTLMVFAGGQPLRTSTGYLDKAALAAFWAGEEVKPS